MDTINNVPAQPIPQLVVQPEVAPAAAPAEVIQPEVIQANATLTEATPAEIQPVEVTPQNNANPAVTPAISTEDKKRRGGRLAKLKPGANSFRFDSPVQKPAPIDPTKIKAVYFLMPSKEAFGSKEEAEQVQHIATQIAAHTEIGTVKGFGIRDQTWEISMTLNTHEGINDDQMLSDALRNLYPTVKALPSLRNGFCVGNSSRWEYRIGVFVADTGGFGSN